MNNTLKKILFFWQEIIFIIALGMYLPSPLSNSVEFFKSPINIIFSAIVLLVLTFLIVQFFKRNFSISVILGAVLGSASLYMILAVVSDLQKPNLDNTPLYGLLFGLFLFLGLAITAFSMPVKYYVKNKNQVQI